MFLLSLLSLCSFLLHLGGATAGSRGSGSGSGGRARSDPSQTNTAGSHHAGSHHAMGTQHTATTGSMDYESSSTQGAATATSSQTWAPTEGSSFTAGAARLNNSAHGHFQGGYHTHGHLRKHHPQASPSSTTTGVTPNTIVLQQSQNPVVTNLSSGGAPHVHYTPSDSTTGSGYMYCGRRIVEQSLIWTVQCSFILHSCCYGLTNQNQGFKFA